MELLHTAEEIKAFGKTIDKARALMNLGREHKDHDLLNLALSYSESVEAELAKYVGLVGQTASAPASRNRNDEFPFSRRHGVVTGDFHFNVAAESVACRFDYEDGGFDNHCLCNLKETMKL